ncbi:RidA family protein [Pseudoxanthobacter sp. M-2]|uniref:RidA family protein n=1 Tax=Pseudoxanthobacter sp. M-2 TaxID=3078754 RepID=UPI0038FCEF24
MNIQHIQPNARLSRAVVGNGQVFVTGQVAKTRTKDCAGQTEEVLAIIDELLAEAGTDRSRMLYAQVWLREIERDFAAMNGVWEKWISGHTPPARATVEAKLAAPDLLVEIAVTALAGN